MTTRLLRGALALGAISIGCGDARDAKNVDFVSVSLEEGGKCLANGDGCGRSWTATSDGSFVYETRDGALTGMLTAQEQSALSDLISEPKFLRALKGEDVTCQGGVSDFEVVITLAVDEREYKDPEAAMCVIDRAWQDHPYYRLRALMKRTAASLFDAGGI